MYVFACIVHAHMSGVLILEALHVNFCARWMATAGSTAGKKSKVVSTFEDKQHL